jgi:hypothetical protein
VLRRDLGIALLVGAVAAAVSWVRLDGRTRGVVWAEDGWFLQNRLEDGALQTLLDPYQGYLHLVPRLIVETAALAPLRDYAVVVTALCCAAVGLVAALTFVCSRDVVASPLARAVLGLVPALVPTGAAEVLGNTANLHWYLLWLTPWLVLCRPRSTRQGWALGAALLVVALTEIQAVYFVPLLLVGLRDRRRLPMTAGLLAGVVVQVVLSVTTERPSDEGTPTLLDLVQGYGLHVFLQQAYPATNGVGEPLVEQGWPLVWLVAAPFLVVLAALLATTRGRDGRLATLAVLIGATAPYVVAMVLNFRSFLAFGDFDLATLAVFSPLRYAVVPAMFVLGAAVVVADRGLSRATRLSRVAAGGLLAGVVALGVWHVDAGPTKRTGGPGWAASVERAERQCREGGVEVVEIRTAPDSWEVFVTCAVVTADGPTG